MLKNKTSGKIISNNINPVQNFADKTLGMLLNKNSDGIILNTRFGIHTIFMQKSIDVLILDNKNRVVKIRKSLAPNRVFLWNIKFATVVELRDGLIEKSGTKIGDKLDF